MLFKKSFAFKRPLRKGEGGKASVRHTSEKEGKNKRSSKRPRRGSKKQKEEGGSFC